jgi:hypothetical protein
MKLVIEHCGKVLRDAIHAASADGFDPRLLDRFKNGARLLSARHQFAMDGSVMTGKTQRN